MLPPKLPTKSKLDRRKRKKARDIEEVGLDNISEETRLNILEQKMIDRMIMTEVYKGISGIDRLADRKFLKEHKPLDGVKQCNHFKFM